MTSLKRICVSFIGIIVVSLIALWLVWVRIEYIRLGYECARLSQGIDTALRVQGKLRLEWERLTAYSELERIASEEFKLAPPISNQVEFVPFHNGRIID